MSAALYTPDILRLATQIPPGQSLAQPQHHVEHRSPLCGSRIIVDVNLDPAGHIIAFAQDVRACALGQAAAALLGRDVLGKTGPELRRVSHALAAWLARKSDELPHWAGLEVFAAARDYPARHAAICLPFEAAAMAALGEDVR